MKTVNSFILFTLLSFSLSAQSTKNVKTYYDLARSHIKESYSVLVNDPNLKHGVYRKYDQRGLKALEIPFVNGKVHGLAKEYYLPQIGKAGDERIKMKIPFVNDKKHGIAKSYVYIKGGEINYFDGEPFVAMEQYFENDTQVREVKYFINGEKEYDSHLINGKTIKWYENGQKKEEYTLLDSKMNGLYTFWYENGQIGKTGNVNQGKEDGQWSYYTENGTKEKEDIYENGSLAKVIDYYSNGVREERVLLQNGNYYFTQFLPSGQKSIEAEVSKSDDLNGELNYAGSYTSWYDNGNLKAKGQYVRQGNTSKKDGYWVFLAESGDTLTHGTYKNDNRVGKWKIFYDEELYEVYDLQNASYYRLIQFDENGDPTGKVYDYYINGQLQWEGELFATNPDVHHGLWTGYYPSGQKMHEATFNQGTPIGQVKEWYENGNLKMEGQFTQDQNAAQFGKIQSSKSGKWIFYNEDGSIQSTSEY